MKNLKISSKLTLSFIIINAAYILCIIAAIWSYSLSNIRLNNMNRRAVEPEAMISKMRNAISKERISTRNLVLLEPETKSYQAAAESNKAEHQEALSLIKGCRDNMEDDADKKAANELLTYYESEYTKVLSEYMSLAQENRDSEASDMLLALSGVDAELDKKIETLSGLVNGKIEFFLADAHIGLVRLLVIAGFVIITVLTLAAFIVKYMKRIISTKIEKLSETAAVLASGILDIDLQSDSDDEIGHLTNSFMSMVENMKIQADTLTAISEGDLSVSVTPRCSSDAMGNAIEKMADNLNHIFDDVTTAITQISGGATQIAEGAQALSQGASEQAAAVEGLSTSISNVLTQTRDNSQNAEKTLELVNRAGSEMQDTAKYMEELKSTMSGISTSSEEIFKVIKVIDDIAFQTNILALNAAVEAARAGQHGKGFAVVADEVRNLASKSAEAAKETSDLIQSSVEYVRRGGEMADKTGRSVAQVVVTAQQAQERIQEISKASQLQEDAIAQVDEGINQISQVVHLNSATAEQSAASSEELSGQSQMLRELMNHFKLKDERRFSIKEKNAPNKNVLKLPQGVYLNG